jgi:hypothetical protein
MQGLIDLALKKIDVLEKKLEKYYYLLKVDNELDFVIKGTYLMQEELDSIMAGEY